VAPGAARDSRWRALETWFCLSGGRCDGVRCYDAPQALFLAARTPPSETSREGVGCPGSKPEGRRDESAFTAGGSATPETVFGLPSRAWGSPEKSRPRPLYET